MKQKKEFSKWLLVQESVLIWIISISFLLLAFYCIYKGYMGSLPWLAAMVGFPWTAYGVSQVQYYKKSEKENTKNGIKYETVLTELQQNAQICKEEFGIDLNNAPTELTYPTFYTDTTNPDEYQI